jgi:hypothetical protein
VELDGRVMGWVGSSRGFDDRGLSQLLLMGLLGRLTVVLELAVGGGRVSRAFLGKEVLGLLLLVLDLLG